MSFRLKTILGIALIESALLLVLVLSTLGFLHSSNQEQLLQRSRTMTQLFAATAKDAVLATDLASLNDLVEEILDQPDVRYARVRGDEAILAEAGNPAALARPFRADLDLRAVEDGIFDVSADILVGNQLFGSVELGLATSNLRAVLERARRWTISIAVLEVLLVVIFSWVLGTWLARQLKHLREASETIAAKGPGVQIPVQGHDEIATAEQAAERELRLAAQVLEANEGIMILATMSHEIRTPLNAIIGMNQLLLESGLSAEQVPFARSAVDGGQLLLALLNNVLDFSKIEAGRLTLEPEWFDPLATVESVVELFSNEAATKGIELAIVTGSDLPLQCFGDRLRIQQILTNLLGNAIKFTEQGGVVVRLDYLPPATSTDGRLCLEICDSGIGLSEVDQARLFGEFVQAEDGATRRFGDTGLGLAISHRLAQLMQGDITCQSAPGAGSRFRAELAMAAAAAEGQVDAELDAAIAALRKIRVVLYSPNPVLARGLREQLEREGIESETLLGIDEVRARAEAGHPGQQRLFVLDTPVQEAERAAVRAFPRAYPNQPSVRLAPNAEVGAIEASKQAGFKATVRKPARRCSLLRYLAVAIGGPITPRASAPRPFALAGISPVAANVLLVEDNSLNVEVARAALQQLRHRVSVVGSGLDALTLVDQEAFDLILMDISMPGMDGLEATRRIRAGQSLNRTTPIIAMTANAFAEDRERCAQAGMNDFLSKPIDIGKLRQLVTQWLSQSASMQAPDFASDAKPDQLTEDAEFPILEQEVLTQLAADTTAELPCMLVDMFLAEIKQRIEELNALLVTGDLPALGAAAHSLKGSAGTLGAGRLHHLAMVLEKAGKAEDQTQAKQALTALERAAEQTRDEMTRWNRLQ